MASQGEEPEGARGAGEGVTPFPSDLFEPAGADSWHRLVRASGSRSTCESVEQGADRTYSKDQFTIGKMGNAPPSLMMFTSPIWIPCKVRA